MKLTIWIQPRDEGGYQAECPELPGAVAHGSTWEETLQAIDGRMRVTFAMHLEQAMATARENLREPIPPHAVSLEFAFVGGEGEEGGPSYATVA